MTVLLVFCGGAAGSVLRYLSDRAITTRAKGAFPFGTLFVNVLGSLVLGFVSGGVTHHHWSANVAALLGTGLCGGFTTFSTFAIESVQLARTSQRLLALSYVAISVALGIGAAALGWQLG